MPKDAYGVAGECGVGFDGRGGGAYDGRDEWKDGIWVFGACAADGSVHEFEGGESLEGGGDCVGSSLGGDHGEAGDCVSGGLIVVGPVGESLKGVGVDVFCGSEHGDAK